MMKNKVICALTNRECVPTKDCDKFQTSVKCVYAYKYAPKTPEDIKIPELKSEPGYFTEG